MTYQLKLLEKYIYNLPAARQLNMLSSLPREAIIRLREAISSARLSIGLYSKSEDTHEQEQFLTESIKQLENVSESILAASQHDLLDTVDVAHLSALNEHIIEKLK